MEIWIYVVVVVAFTLGYLIGHRKGKSDSQQEMIYQQQRMEATKIWAESMKPYMGGKHVGPQ